MSTQLLQEIGAKIASLSAAEKRRLLVQLTHEVRQVTEATFANSLATMAADPEIQRECQRT